MSVINRLDSASSADYSYLRGLLTGNSGDGALPARLAAAHNTTGQSKYVKSALGAFKQRTLQEISASSGLMVALEEAAAFVTSDQPHVMRKQIERYLQMQRDKELYKEAEKISEELAAEAEGQAAAPEVPLTGEALAEAPAAEAVEAEAVPSGSQGGQVSVDIRV